ncbi:LrgB family protein [Burkholderia sp. KCJ3K979]|uniref:LrgB family protein n=1 Tax=Burkholderia TaxID=32008 RepID=UPI0019298FDB|nr:LrgB family protein [Burkholderia sp. KCJ3K979]MBL3963724.1 LrgB family protein [Burkholderia sp. KCJ3K979]
MTSDLASAWAALQHQPLWGLLATLVAYRIGQVVNRAAHGHVLAHPVLVAVLMLVGFLSITHVQYSDYLMGAQYVHFLLGPATVALAIPMFRNLHHIRRTARALVPALAIGSIVSAGSAAFISKALGATPVVTASLIAHSATTPIAMSISRDIGGDPSLTATFTLLTGIAAVLQIGVAMKVMRIVDARAHGLAAGTAGHGLAAARMLSISETAGAFGGLAIGMSGILTALVAPLLAALTR